jgi:hypothetical protein
MTFSFGPTPAERYVAIFSNGSEFLFENCTFNTQNTQSFFGHGGVLALYNCTLNYTGDGAYCGIDTWQQGKTYLYKCDWNITATTGQAYPCLLTGEGGVTYVTGGSVTGLDNAWSAADLIFAEQSEFGHVTLNAVVADARTFTASYVGTLFKNSNAGTSSTSNMSDFLAGTGQYIYTSVGTKIASTTDHHFNNLDISGTVDGRDVATDGTKLDGIEALATADQTAGEIEAIVTHDNLLGVNADEHIDWSLTNAKNIHPDNYTNYVLSSSIEDLSDVVATVGAADDGKVLTYQDGAGNFQWLAVTGTGTVTSITAGAGLTGGVITTAGTLSVNAGTSANQIVQLNGSAELPAVSGANLTNLPAPVIGVNSIDDTMIDFGLGAGQVSTTDIPEGTNLYVTAPNVAAVLPGYTYTHSPLYIITAANETTNASGQLVLSAATLGFDCTGAIYYAIYINRILLRQSEASLNTGTGEITFATNVVLESDSIEAVFTIEN